MTFAQVPVDEVRSYWDRRPCNLRHSDAPIGSRRYFDEVEFRKYRVEPHIPGFAQFHRWRGKRVLEVGCGIGTDTINFARAGARVTALDLSSRSLALARIRAGVYVEDVTFLEADAEDLSPIWSHWYTPFDLVYSFGVIHHSPHPALALREMRSVIDDDGELRIMIYHRRSTKVAALVLRHPLRALRGIDHAVAVQSEAQTGCPITYTYTKRQARKLVEAAGFEVAELYVDHIFPWAIRPYRRHELVQRWYWRLVPQGIFRRLERRFGWHLMVTCFPKLSR